MNEEMKKKLQSAISACADACENANTALDAMQYAQAACNLSNVIVGLHVNKIDDSSKKKSLTSDEKLKLIEEPLRKAINQLRYISDDTSFEIDEESQCSLANLALWLEGIFDEHEGYMPWCSESARAKLGLADN